MHSLMLVQRYLKNDVVVMMEMVLWSRMTEVFDIGW